MIKAEIVADSLNQFGNRITTMVVTMPRFILAEFNTHRMFSRNSASSRAIPFEKMIKSVKENPFVPIAWMKNHKGMQGTEYYTTETCKEAWLEIDRCFGYTEFENKLAVDYLNKEWRQDAADAVANVENWGTLDITKQMINRQLEPFMWHTVIVTATEWENFFALRCPQYTMEIHTEDTDAKIQWRSKKDVLKTVKQLVTDTPALYGEFYEKLKAFTTLDWLKTNEGQAEIHMMALAEAMWDALNESIPKTLEAGEWHIPFDLTGEEASRNALTETGRIKIATARCARVSYTVVGEEDKPFNPENDIKLHDHLATSGHWSPFEHCAQAMGKNDIKETYDKLIPWSGNFHGFVQYRKTFHNENKTVQS
jgi:thymidylate synthase ThyX